jgi:hypothetical protein
MHIFLQHPSFRLFHLESLKNRPTPVELPGNGKFNSETSREPCSRHQRYYSTHCSRKSPWKYPNEKGCKKVGLRLFPQVNSFITFSENFRQMDLFFFSSPVEEVCIWIFSSAFPLPSPLPYISVPAFPFFLNFSIFTALVNYFVRNVFDSSTTDSEV